eukprot:c5294_g1_i1 orf=70-306(+)
MRGRFHRSEWSFSKDVLTSRFQPSHELDSAEEIVGKCHRMPLKQAFIPITIFVSIIDSMRSLFFFMLIKHCLCFLQVA